MSAAIPPHPQYAFMAWCSSKKQRDTFSFTFTFKHRIRYLGVVFSKAEGQLYFYHTLPYSSYYRTPNTKTFGDVTYG